jgi:hypothetical protein
VQGKVCEVYGDSLYSLCCRDHQEETPVALEAAGQEAAVGDVLQARRLGAMVSNTCTGGINSPAVWTVSHTTFQSLEAHMGSRDGSVAAGCQSKTQVLQCSVYRCPFSP